MYANANIRFLSDEGDYFVWLYLRPIFNLLNNLNMASFHFMSYIMNVN